MLSIYPEGATSTLYPSEHSLANWTEAESATLGGFLCPFSSLNINHNVAFVACTPLSYVTCIVSFMSVLDILLVLREVEETSLLSESERMLSKTILVPGANHAQVNIGIHATWLKRWYTVWALNKIFVSMAMVKAQVSSGSIPEDVIDNDIDPELTEEQAHQVGRWSW